MNDLQVNNFIGNLDKDSDPLYISNGDYSDALNIRPITTDTESTNSIIPVLGNRIASSLGSVSAQNKKYALFFNTTVLSPSQPRFKIYNQNNLLLTTISYPISSLSLTTHFNTDVVPAFSAALGALVPSQTYNISFFTTDDVFGYIIFEITTVTGLEYTVTNAFSQSDFVTVINEAYDISLSGDLSVIGSYDVLGDLFIFSSNVDSLPSVAANITTISNTFPVIVTTSSPHGLSVGQLISISGNSINGYNGKFIIGSTLSLTQFTLANQINLGAGTGGNINKNIQGLGEIGVLTYDENLNSYSYTRLLRSKQLNLLIPKQIDSYIERNSQKISIYFTDDYNTPRVLYYYGDYKQDGFLTFFNPDSTFSSNSPGKYSYDTVGLESRLQVNQLPTFIGFVSQAQSGGSIRSGNWRYSYRFITQGGSSTEWSLLSNPVPVFASSTGGSGSAISGDIANTPTSKANTFTVINIPTGLFTEIEIAGVQYLSKNSQVGYIIKRVSLNTNISTINFTHTGFENYESLDLGTLNDADINYETAKNIVAIDNRLVLSNLTSSQKQDFTEWAKTFNHSLVKSRIENTIGSNGSFTVGEYNNPDNVFYNVGYMDNETYRFGIRVRLKSDGSLSDVFWVDDIKFDSSITNITSPNRRISGLPFYNLSDNTSAYYTTAVDFSNINLDYIIDGARVGDLISEIIFMRTECVPEILATGVAALSVYNNLLPPTNIGSLGAKGLWYNDYSTSTAVLYQGEYPFLENGLNPVGATQTPYPGSGIANRQVFAFYSQDVFYGQANISFIPGDKIFGHGSTQVGLFNVNNNGKFYSSVYSENNGTIAPVLANPLLVDVTKAQFLGAGASIPSFGIAGYTKSLKTYQSEPTGGSPVQNIDSRWSYLGTPIIEVNTALYNQPFNTNTDYGLHYIQYYRPILYNGPDDSKYGNRNLSQYIPVGKNIVITINSPVIINSALVYGGDTFTQKSFIKRKFATSSLTHGINGLGWGSGFAMYSQNRVNAQLNKKYGETSGVWAFPNKPLNEWIEITEPEINTTPVYNTGYNIVNNINTNIAFSESSTRITDFPVRIIYSELKSQNGITDGYREFLALNFKDLDLSFGEIVHMANGNGELITWQPRKFQRQYFNTRGVLQGSSNLNILIGDGSVLSRDGQTLSTIGTKHKWSVIKGRSPQGNDTFYWINTELKKVMRLGYDGTISLADIRGMQSFFANNLTYVDDKDNPASGEGICGVWDDRYLEVIFTIRGKRVFNNWSNSINYTVGSYVSYTPSIFSTFEKTGEIYECILGGNIGINPQVGVNYWKLIPHSDNKFYNEYSVVFNEAKNGFQSFFTPKPKIYLKWKDTYFTARPVFPVGNIYIHNLGDYCQWYDGNQTQDGYIECVVNKNENEVKWFSALRANSQSIPERYDFKTLNHISYLSSSEIKNREGSFDAPIKKDSTISGINNGNTTGLFGKFIKIKMTFKNGVYQKLFSIITKFRISPRFSNK